MEPEHPLIEAVNVLPDPIITSLLFQIRSMPGSGRGVFALQNLPPGTRLLTSPDPVTHVITDRFRRECCNWCFAYDRGTRWKIAYHPQAQDGTATPTPSTAWFCQQACMDMWVDYMGEVGREAWCTVDGAFATARKSRSKKKDAPVDQADRLPPCTSVSDVEKVWKDAEKRAEPLREARLSQTPNKAQKRILRETVDKLVQTVDEDDVVFFLSGIIAAHKSTRSASSFELWQTLLALTPSFSHYITYRYKEDFLQSHVDSFHILLCLVPAALMPYCTPLVFLQITCRDVQNSFGIRSESEFLGYGTWPSASFFNHSCVPNVHKDRHGRTWTFKTAVEVPAGAQLCISYLGEMESEVNGFVGRAEKLQAGWGFACACEYCVQEHALSRTPAL